MYITSIFQTNYEIYCCRIVAWCVKLLEDDVATNKRLGDWGMQAILDRYKAGGVSRFPLIWITIEFLLLQCKIYILIIWNFFLVLLSPYQGAVARNEYKIFQCLFFFDKFWLYLCYVDAIKMSFSHVNFRIWIIDSFVIEF